jgi:predicted nucleotidyltransferase component of viral defense system
MIEKELIEWISNEKGITNKSFIEKDLLLQGLLLELEKSEHFAQNFAFKGGTCLTKAYFGYYRFSEDLDFTWMNTQKFSNLSNKGTRKQLSKEINHLLTLFETIAMEMKMDFKPIKSDKHYVQLGGSNRFCTFKFWYDSATSETPTFIKIQINFTEKITYPNKIHELKPLCPENAKELQAVYPENARLAIQSARLPVYDLQEIAAEKVRAILTRRGVKARDYVDLHVLRQNKITVESVKKLAIEKTLFMLGYEKYSQNLSTKTFTEKIDLGKEEALMIQPIGKDFSSFVEKTQKELSEIAQTITNEYMKTKSWSELTKPLHKAKKKIQEEDVVDLVHRIRKEK